MAAAGTVAADCFVIPPLIVCNTRIGNTWIQKAIQISNCIADSVRSRVWHMLTVRPCWKWPVFGHTDFCNVPEQTYVEVTIENRLEEGCALAAWAVADCLANIGTLLVVVVANAGTNPGTNAAIAIASVSRSEFPDGRTGCKC